MCKECNNTGLMPFVNKRGETIPNTFTDCFCKPIEIPARHVLLKPEDIDFPVSREFYRYYAFKNHWTDPGPMQEPVYSQQKELVKLEKIIAMPIKQGNRRKSAF